MDSYSSFTPPQMSFVPLFFIIFNECSFFQYKSKLNGETYPLLWQLFCCNSYTQLLKKEMLVRADDETYHCQKVTMCYNTSISKGKTKTKKKKRCVNISCQNYLPSTVCT